MANTPGHAAVPDEPYEPYLSEVLALIERHLRRHPDPTIVEAAWRMGLVTSLTEIIRGYHMLPDAMEAYLGRIVDAIRADTTRHVREWDTHAYEHE